VKVVIAGGSGFLGRALTQRLTAGGHTVVVLTRGTAGSDGPGVQRTTWMPNGETGPWAGELDGAHAVVNLAGASLADRRWSAEYKQQILNSRVHATRSLAGAIAAARTPPAVLVSASAVGYYGPHGDEPLTETTPAGSDLLAQVCVQWEAEANRAATSGTRVVCVRGGLALAVNGGAVPRMLPPFKMGLGGPVGSGRQYWAWIHRDDWASLVLWAIHSDAVEGPVNGTAPEPATSTEFARSLGRALHRPAVLPVPAFALRLLFGEMAEATLLSGQRAIPAKATALGFSFRYPRIDDAFDAIFGAHGSG
jgi:uncharacterized protein (TIGR01777 family)